MEPQVLDERVEWEARRVAAAFEVEEWMAFKFDEGWEFSGVGRGSLLVSWTIENSTAQWFGSEIGPKTRAINSRWRKPWTFSCQVWRDPEDVEVWICFSHSHFNEFMAQGLYCLGFEDKEVLAQINHPLTAHEKMELRLSIPREFWPQTWRHEEEV